MKFKVLIVDDDIGILEVVDLILKSHGYETICRMKGYETFEVLEMEQPDVILLDVGLPDIPGSTVCKLVKEKQDIPIVIFSAHASLADICQECKADAYLSKPFDIDELLTVIEKHAA